MPDLDAPALEALRGVGAALLGETETPLPSLSRCRARRGVMKGASLTREGTGSRGAAEVASESHV